MILEKSAITEFSRSTGGAQRRQVQTDVWSGLKKGVLNNQRSLLETDLLLRVSRCRIYSSDALD